MLLIFLFVMSLVSGGYLLYSLAELAEKKENEEIE